MQEIAALQNMSKRLAWTGAVLGLLFLFSIVDMLASGFLTPKNSFSALVGSSQWVNGTLSSPVKDINTLYYRLDTPRITVVFKQVQGRLWRGLLEVAPETQPGDYTLAVSAHGIPADAGPPTYQVHIYDTSAALKQSYPSLIRRHLGFHPLYMIVVTLLLVMTGLAASYVLSSRMESHLEQRGIVPIAKMARNKSGWEIHFALGGLSGIRIDDRLEILDPAFAPVGEVAVSQVHDDHGIAMVPKTIPISPSHWIARRGS